MSVVIKTTEMQYRDANGVYHGINAVAEKKIADQEAALNQIIAEAQGAVNQLETQKNTIAQTVASMAQFGTDTTLSTPGMAADAGACGVLKSALSDNRFSIISSAFQLKTVIQKRDLTNGTYKSSSMDEIDTTATNFIRTIAPYFMPKNGYVYVDSDYNNEKTVYIGRYDTSGNYLGQETLTSDYTNRYFSPIDQYIVLSFNYSSISSFSGSIYLSFPQEFNRNIITQSNIVSGGTTRKNGAYYFTTNANRVRLNNFIIAKKGDSYTFHEGTNVKAVYIEALNADTYSTLGESGWLTDGKSYAIPADGVIMMIFKNSSGISISVSDFDATLSMIRNSVTERMELEYGYYNGSSANRTYSASLNVFMNSKINVFYLNKADATGIECLTSGANTYVMFFGENQAFISSAASSGNVIQIPSSCVYVGVYTESTSLDYMDFKLYGITGKPHFAKRYARTTGYPTNSSDWLGFVVKDDVFSDMHIILPPNYSIDGAPVPLIVWMRGSSGSSDWDEEIGTNEYLKKYTAYLRDEGFAVCSMHTWGSYYNNKYGLGVENASPYVTPTCIETFQKGIEHITKRYNIDANNVHLLGYSQGGQFETYCVTYPVVPLKSVCMFSPVNDYLSMPGSSLYSKARKAIAEDLGLTGNVQYYISDEYNTYTSDGIAFIQENAEKINFLNEAWTGLVGGTLASRVDDALTFGAAFWEGGTAHTDLDNIYTRTNYAKMGKVPTKIWIAADDDSTPYQKTVELVNQLQNGGCMAILRTMPNNTGSHGAATYNNLVESVTTALNITYTDIPTAWIEAVSFMRECMAK